MYHRLGSTASPPLPSWSGGAGGKGTPTTHYPNAREGVRGNPSVHALFESPASESDLDREVVFFLKDM